MNKIKMELCYYIALCLLSIGCKLHSMGNYLHHKWEDMCEEEDAK